MAQGQPFFKQEIDRTPYLACVWVAVLVVAFFLLGATLLWRTASAIKPQGFFDRFERRGDTSPSSNSSTGNLIDQVQNAGTNASKQLQEATQEKVEETTENAQQQAADAAKREAEQQFQNQLQKIKGDAF